MTLGAIRQGDMTTLNVCTLNTTSKYIKQKLKIGVGKFPIIVRDSDKALSLNCNRMSGRGKKKQSKKSVQKI